MIEACVWRGATGKIESVEVKGHADFGPPGSDVLCAAVSALANNTVSSIREILGVEIGVKAKSGYLRLDIPPHRQTDDVQLLLRCLVHGLEKLAMEFPEHIKVSSSS